MNHNLETLQKDIQQVIIGSILLDGSLLGTKGVVSSKNFINYDDGYHFKNIYQAFEQLLDSGIPIDLLSVQKVCIDKYQNTYEPYLIKCMNNIVSTTNLVYHCYILLEIDIKTKFIKTIKDCIDDKELEQYQVEITKQVISEIYLYDIDTFEAISSARNAFIHYKYPKHIIQTLNEFETNISEKAKQIKGNTFIVSFFKEYIRHINKVNVGDCLEAQRLLMDIMAHIYFNEKISNVALNHIRKARTSL